jgi:fumarate reductase subunit C
LLKKVSRMERNYWLARNSVAAMMARQATSAEARLIHYEMAGLYSLKAAGAARRCPWTQRDLA